jgi:hypothetical protein
MEYCDLSGPHIWTFGYRTGLYQISFCSVFEMTPSPRRNLKKLLQVMRFIEVETISARRSKENASFGGLCDKPKYYKSLAQQSNCYES